MNDENKKPQKEKKEASKFKLFVLKYKFLVSCAVILLVFFILLTIATKGYSLHGFLEENRVAIRLGEIEIMWYAIFIIFGMLSGVFLALMEAKAKNINLDDIYTGLIIFVPAAILGLRAYYLAFDGVPGNFFRDFLKFNEGGLAINGAIIVVLIGIFPFCKWKKIPVWALLDIVLPAFFIGQIFGRWGNYMNGEAHGPLLTSPFLKAIIPSFILNNYDSGGPYHPTFLYEGLWNFVGLLLVFIFRNKVFKNDKKFIQLGDITCFYLFWYGLGRGAIIEPLRTDPLQIGDLRLNVIVNIGLMVLGIGLIIAKRIIYRKKPLPYYFDYRFIPAPPKVKQKKVKTNTK